MTRRAGYAPAKQKDSTYSSGSPSPEPKEFEIPLPPERDSSYPTPQAPRPEPLKRTKEDLLTSLSECEQALLEGVGIDIVDMATSSIRLAQRYRAAIKHENWKDEKKLRRDAVDVLMILRRIAEREGGNANDEEKEIVKVWCKDVRKRVERDDEVRREMWERAIIWMDAQKSDWGN